MGSMLAGRVSERPADDELQHVRKTYSTNQAPRAQPFLKWAGGKWSIADQIARLLPADLQERTYREPFVGGGAMFFYLMPRRAVLSDALADLINAYRIVQTDVEPLIERLADLRASHSKEQFYEVRERFNSEPLATPLDRAAWLVYLNKTCFNGLFRTNQRGAFNVPFGRFKNPSIVAPDRLRAAAEALRRADLRQKPFEHLLRSARAGDVIYFDPPYVPVSRTANFAAYADGAFTDADQERLADVFRRLDARGCLLALSNSDAPKVHELYRGFDIRPIQAARSISANGTRRGPIVEVLVRNTKRYPRRKSR